MFNFIILFFFFFLKSTSSKSFTNSIIQGQKLLLLNQLDMKPTPLQKEKGLRVICYDFTSLSVNSLGTKHTV